MGKTITIAKGASLKVLAEFPSNIPGIAKVQLREVRLEPGAKVENLVIPLESYVTAIQGQLMIVKGGKTMVRGAGASWNSPKGTKVSIYNRGSEPHVHHSWRPIPFK